MEHSYCYGCMEPIGPDEQICPHCGFRTSEYTPEAHHLFPGMMLRERYVVGKVLGEGGFGITYVGKDTVLDLKVAIKEFYMSGYVNRNCTSSTKVKANSGSYGETFRNNREKFLNEARVLAKFANEEGIVGIRDFFQENDTAYIVMDFLSGETLRSYIDRVGKLPEQKALEILRPVFASLTNIHNHDIIHRDISPDNIMLTEDGKVKLLDFGAARQVSKNDIKSLSIILKPGYAPEEQYRSKGRQGPWTDIYALCATLYRCITGVVPDDAMERMFDDKLPAPADMDCACSPAMSAVIMKGLAVRQADRYQNLQELCAALEQVALHPDSAAVSKAPIEDPERTITPMDNNTRTIAATVTADRTAYVKQAAEGKPQNSDATVFAKTDDSANTRQIPKAETPKQKEPPKREEPPKPVQSASHDKLPKKKRKLPLILGAAVVVVLLVVLISGLGGGSKDSVSSGSSSSDSGTTVSSGKVPAPYDSFSMTLNDNTVSVPTTFAALEELGWLCADEAALQANVAPDTNYADSLMLSNGQGKIQVAYCNPTSNELTVAECPIYKITATSVIYFDNGSSSVESKNTLTTEGGFILGETTVKEFKEAAASGYEKSSEGSQDLFTYEAGVHESYEFLTTQIYEFGFRDTDDILFSVVIQNRDEAAAAALIGADSSSYSTEAPDYDKADLLNYLGAELKLTYGDFTYPIPATIAEFEAAGFTVENAPEFVASGDPYQKAFLRADTFNTMEPELYNPFRTALSAEHCFIDQLSTSNIRSENHDKEFTLKCVLPDAEFEIYYGMPKEDLEQVLIDNGLTLEIDQFGYYTFCPNPDVSGLIIECFINDNDNTVYSVSVDSNAALDAYFAELGI